MLGHLSVVEVAASCVGEQQERVAAEDPGTAQVLKREIVDGHHLAPSASGESEPRLASLQGGLAPPSGIHRQNFSLAFIINLRNGHRLRTYDACKLICNRGAG